MEKPYWDSEEIEILKQEYPTKNKEETLLRLSPRTWDGITHKASRLGIHKSRRSNFAESRCKTLSDAEAAYIAGFIDGEGTISLNRLFKKHPHPTFYPLVRIDNVNKEVLTWINERIGGRLHHIIEKRINHQNKWRLDTARTLEITELLKQLIPFLKVKRKHAEVLFEFCELRLNTAYRNRTSTEFESFEKLREFNRRGIDAKAKNNF